MIASGAAVGGSFNNSLNYAQGVLAIHQFVH
jgi:hypothetical protein